MSLREKFANLITAAQTSMPYWRDIAISDFTRDLQARMERMGITHTELAARMGTSRPYVTKLLSGGNFTLETMVKLAMALDGAVRIQIEDRDAIPPGARSTVEAHNRDEVHAVPFAAAPTSGPQRKLTRCSALTPPRAAPP